MWLLKPEILVLGSDLMFLIELHGPADGALNIVAILKLALVGVAGRHRMVNQSQGQNPDNQVIVAPGCSLSVWTIRLCLLVQQPRRPVAGRHRVAIQSQGRNPDKQVIEVRRCSHSVCAIRSCLPV